MATKKASKSAAKASRSAQDPHKILREAQAQAEQQNNAVVCRRLDDLVNELLRRECAQKHFDQTSGNCKERGCQQADEPKIVPCLHLRWGEGAQDRLETEDTEVLCLTVCNPYSNVALNDFTVQLVVTDASGNAVPNLPDGTPSVQIKPSFMICFGDIPPCDPQRPAQSCISREVVLLTRGAKVGSYALRVVYCFQACFTKLGFDTVFKLDLVAS